MSYEVINGNALALPLEDESVDLIVTSPPYFSLRSYRDDGAHYDGQVGSEATPQEFLEALWAATAEMVRVLKPSGSIWVNLGDKYAGSGGHNNASLHSRGLDLGDFGGGEFRSAPKKYNQNADIGGRSIPAKSLMGLPWRYAIGCVDQLGLILRAEIIWSKPNGLPESVTDRVRRSHEQWFHFTKQGQYFSSIDEIREPHLHPPNGGVFGGAKKGPQLAAAGRATYGKNTYDTLNPLGKLPSSVWTIPSEPLIVPEHLGLPDHFAAFPQEWPRRIILGWSPSGICTACGEGRRPVVEKRLANVWHDKPDDDSRYLGERDAHQHNLYGVKTTFGSTEATITGYDCACEERTAFDDCLRLPPTTSARILDPFGGTGTVAGVAHALGRHGISVDLSADYCRLAEWRISQSGHFQKAYERSAAEGAVVPLVAPKDTAAGKQSLFGEAS